MICTPELLIAVLQAKLNGAPGSTHAPPDPSPAVVNAGLREVAALLRREQEREGSLGFMPTIFQREDGIDASNADAADNVGDRRIKFLDDGGWVTG